MKSTVGSVVHVAKDDQFGFEPDDIVKQRPSARIGSSELSYLRLAFGAVTRLASKHPSRKADPAIVRPGPRGSYGKRCLGPTFRIAVGSVSLRFDFDR